MEESGDTKSDRSGNTYLQWMVAVLAATTLLSYGLQGGWISPMLKVLQSDESPTGRSMTETEISWIASTMSIAAVFGVPLYVYIADAYGRKIGVIAMAIPQALCWVIKLTSSSTIALFLARICAGVPAGGCFNLVPMYVKEISQDNIRGVLGSMVMMFQNIGLLTMYGIGGYLDYYTILWVNLSVPIVTTIFMLIAPESPAFLVKQGKIESAVKTMALLRGLDVKDKRIANEIEQLKKEKVAFQIEENITFIGIFKNKAWRKAFILCMLLLSALDLNGYFTILNYAWTILKESGVSVNAELQALSIPAIMILGSLVSMSCVEKFGRKPLLVGTFAISALTMACLATIMLMKSYGASVPSWISVLAIIINVFSYAAGILPMTYVVLAEIFNFQVRAKLMGCIVAYGWFVSFVQLAIYGPITQSFGLYTLFYFFATSNILGAFITLFKLPETKGKSVEEIEKILLATNKF